MTASAQEIKIDWADKSVKEQPTEIHKGEKVKVTALNVNDILYDYKVSVSLQTQAAIDDFALLSSFLTAASNQRTGIAQDCSTPLSQARTILDQINADIKKPANNLVASASGPPITLNASLKGWDAATKTDDRLKKLEAAVADVKDKCPGADSKDFLAAYDALSRIRQKAEGAHTASGESVASSAEVSSVSIEITESVKDATGNQQVLTTYTKTLSFSSVLNLSAGVLFSTLRHPNYIRQTVPNNAQPVLAIDGGSEPTPYLVGLLNYRFPGLSWSKVGFALSTGPVLRVGGDSGASTFSYFNGVSFEFWNRLFVTAGSHVGQFPDIPEGFQVGQAIPANFGQLAPTNRWSARFAVAVTYKTQDLGALKPTSKNASSGSGNKGSTKPGTGSSGSSGAGTSSGTRTQSFAETNITSKPQISEKKKKKFLGIF